MRRYFLLPLLAWEGVVLGCIAVVMIVFRKTLNSENIRLLEIVSATGVIVVLISWPLCRWFSRPASLVIGATVGLLVPFTSVYLLGPIMPDFMSIHTALVGIVLSLPSSVGGMFAGGLQARRSV